MQLAGHRLPTPDLDPSETVKASYLKITYAFQVQNCFIFQAKILSGSEEICLEDEMS